MALASALVAACAGTRPSAPPAAEPPAAEPAGERPARPPAAPGPAEREEAPPPEIEPPPRAPTPDPSAEPSGGISSSVRAAVREAASDRGRPAQRAAGALRAIADLLDRLAAGAPAPAGALARMREEIGALEELGAIDLDRADRVKAALDHGVEALRRVARAREAGWLRPWIDGAAAAAEAVDRSTPLGLQRAAVQDALRSLADAALAARQFGGG